jgi:GTP-binding protein
VGKSSLINAVTRVRGLARTSATPGKTQALNFYRVAGARLVDLPGYGFARAPQDERARWSRLVDDYLNTRAVLAATIVVVDARHRAFPDDRDMVDWALGRRLPCLVVATKADKLARGALLASLAALREGLALGARPGGSGGEALVPFSSTSGLGRREVLNFLERFAS